MNVGMIGTGNVGVRLRFRRGALDLSSRHVARIASIGTTNYSCLERVPANPVKTVLLKIAHALEASIKDIVSSFSTFDLTEEARAPFSRAEKAAWIVRTGHGSDSE